MSAHATLQGRSSRESSNLRGGASLRERMSIEFLVHRRDKIEGNSRDANCTAPDMDKRAKVHQKARKQVGSHLERHDYEPDMLHVYSASTHAVESPKSNNSKLLKAELRKRQREKDAKRKRMRRQSLSEQEKMIVRRKDALRKAASRRLAKSQKEDGKRS